MAKFCVSFITHLQAHCHKLYYHVDMVRAGLIELGHDVIVAENSTESGRTNILIGYHLLTEVARAQLINDRAHRPYIVLQTEVVKANSMFRKQVRKTAYDRFFGPLFAGAQAVWECVDEANAALLPNVTKAPLFRGGYTPLIRDFTPRPWDERDIDFCFYGTPSPHREGICNVLRSRGYRVALFSDLHRPVRNDVLSRTKVALAPRWSKEAEYFSWARCTYAWQHMLNVSFEQAIGCEEWPIPPIIRDEGAFIEQCEMALEYGSFTGFDHFRSFLTMRGRMRDLLEVSL